MTFMMTALAFAIATPALAQAADPHAAHRGHDPVQPRGATSGCCEKTAQGGQKDCCDKSRNEGKGRDCCDEAKADGASGHDAHAH